MYLNNKYIINKQFLKFYLKKDKQMVDKKVVDPKHKYSG